jgi:glycosyltransferase involved in cell wall biosynthesis
MDVGAPLVMSVEGLEEFEVPAGAKRLAYAPFRSRMRRAAANADAVVATDRALQPVVERHLGIAVSDQVMIPNAVDPEACRALADDERGRALLADLGVDRKGPVFLSVGRLEANKGFDVLARALAAAGLAPGWTWVLVGDGPLRASIETTAQGLGIASNTVFAGRLPDADLHSLAAAADWFVHPTLYEGSSLVTLEAMAHGLPVIASDAGGLPDKVVDGETGFLVPPGDVAALAEVLNGAADVDGEALGEAGRRRCEELFSWDSVIDRYIELYRSLAAGGDGRETALPN